jgi:Fe-S oxidoreductase
MKTEELNEKARLCSVCFKMCRDVCPVAGATRHEADSPHNRAFFAYDVMEERKKLDGEIARYFFRCALCRACREACETGQDTGEIMLASRRELPEKLIPDGLREKADAVKNGALYGPESKGVRVQVERWVDTGEKTLLLFGRRMRAGGTSGEESVGASVSLMEKLDIPFSVMEEEPDTGVVAYFTGFSPDAKRLAEDFAKKVLEKNPKTLVVSSADDLRMIRLVYPELGIDFGKIEVMSLPEFLAQEIRKKNIVFSEINGSRRIAYHDPCGLGRELRIFEAPRELIRSVPGVELCELAFNRDQAPCCGYGVGLFLSYPDITRKMAMRILSLAEAAGADALVFGCPTCRDVVLQYVDDDTMLSSGGEPTVELFDLPLFLNGVLR